MWRAIPRRSWVAWGLFGAGFAVVAGYHAVLPIDVDETWVLTVGWQITQGVDPLRGLYEFHTPGAFYLAAAIIKLFGASVWPLRLVVTLLTAATVWPLLRLAQLLGLRGWQPPVVLAAWLVLLTMFPWVHPSHLAQLGGIWTAWALISAWRTRRLEWFVLAGAIAGLSVWLLQTRGGALVISGAVVTLAARRVTLLAAYFAGVVVVCLPFLLWPPALLWHSLVTLPATQYLPSQFVGVQLVAITVGFLAGLALLAMAVGVVPSGFWPLWAVAVSLAVSIWSRADVAYWSTIAWPLALLFFSLLASPWPRLAARSRQAVRIVSWYGGALLAAQVLGWAAINGASRIAMTISDQRAGRTNLWQGIAAAVTARTSPGEQIFAVPYLPGAYFFSQRPNATPYNTLLSNFHPPEIVADAISRLERVKPKVVVRARDSFAVRRGFHQDGTALDTYLNDHYRVVQSSVAGYAVEILERRPGL